MSWQAVCEILRELVPDQAEAIDTRIRSDLAGVRLSIPPINRVIVSREDVQREVRKSGGRVDQAADRLGISPATVYRRLRPQEPGPRMNGRIVR